MDDFTKIRNALFQMQEATKGLANELKKAEADLAAARALLREVQAYVLPDDERARRLTDRIDAALKGDEK